MAVITPSISLPSVPTPPPLPPAVEPFVFTAYGTLVQDYIDGRIRDFAAYYTPISIIQSELNILRDGLFRKYHRARKEMLQSEGKKNLSVMPGYVLRKLMDLALDEKREVSVESLKLTAAHVDTSLTAVYEGADLAVKSDALRADTHIKIQSMSFEVAKAALMAGYEFAKRHILQFESQLKAIKTEFELVVIEYGALVAAVEAEISAIKIEILNAEDIGLAEELQRYVAELETARVQILEAQSRLPLAQTEVAKALAQMDILKAEQALATFKELAANASMDKSRAREISIEVSRQKIALELTKVDLETDKDAANTASELSTIAARSVEEALENTKATRRVLQIDTETALTGAKEQIAEADIDAAAATETYLEGRSSDVAGRVVGRAFERDGDISSRATIESVNIETRATTKAGLIESRADERVDDLDSRAYDTETVLEHRAAKREADLDHRATDKVTDLTARATDRIATLTTRQNTRTAEYRDRKADRTSKIAIQSVVRQNNLSAAANEITIDAHSKAALLDMRMDDIRNRFTKWMSDYRDALVKEAEGALNAAANAANADVSTTYVYTKGTGTPAPPPAPAAQTPSSPKLPEPWDF
jgi:hypothetical protein